MLTDEQRAALERLRFHRSRPSPLRYTDSPYCMALGQGNHCIDGAKLHADVAIAAEIALQEFPPGVEPVECVMHLIDGKMIDQEWFPPGTKHVRGYFIPQREESSDA